MFTEVDEHLKCFLPDYLINLIVPKEIEDFGKFYTALSSLVKYGLPSISSAMEPSSSDAFMLARTAPNDSVRIIKEFTNIDITVNEEE